MHDACESFCAVKVVSFCILTNHLHFLQFTPGELINQRRRFSVQSDHLFCGDKISLYEQLKKRQNGF
jgi:hypothetical protein